LLPQYTLSRAEEDRVALAIWLFDSIQLSMDANNPLLLLLLPPLPPPLLLLLRAAGGATPCLAST
jgi:hypothetical protein